jgi:uncharacterized protein
MMSEGQTEQPQIEIRELTPEARNWGMLCHLSALLGFIPPFIGVVLGPLVLWLLKGKEHPFIDACGRESLNFQISMLIYAALTTPLFCIGIGFVLWFALWALDAVLVIVAAYKANDGVVYRYPMTMRLIR